MEKYYFVVTTNGVINCYNIETNELLAQGRDKFDINHSDFWTLFDNIYGNDYDLCINNFENIPAHNCQLYKLSIDDDGELCGEWDDFVTYSLSYEIGYKFPKKYVLDDVDFIKLNELPF